MRDRRTWTVAIVGVGYCALIASGGCNPATGPAGGQQVNYTGTIVQGDGQGGPAGTTLPTQLIVRFDAVDKTTGQLIGPARNAQVHWHQFVGGGSVVPLANNTNSLGEVTADWTLDRLNSGTQQISAAMVVPGASAGTEAGLVIFSATAGGPQAFTIASGDAQTGPAGQPLPLPLDVLFAGNGLPIANAPITWAVVSGGGSLSSNAPFTDATGHNTILWTLGPSLGQQVVSATVDLVSGTQTLLFSATATSPANLSCSNPVGNVVAETISVNTAWTKSGSPYHVNQLWILNGATVTVSPGALVCIQDGQFIAIATDGSSAALHVNGTAVDPVDFEPESANGFFSGIFIDANTSGTASTTILNQARIHSGQLNAAGAIQMIDSRIDSAGGVIEFGVNGAPYSITNSTVNASGQVEFRSPGLVDGLNVTNSSLQGINILSDTVTIQNCEVSGNGLEGIFVSFGKKAIQIHHCNLFGNGAEGVSYTGVAGDVSATGNWWGDAAGPNGPNGDGVSAIVDASGFLTTPALVGPFPTPPLGGSATPRSMITQPPE